MAKILIVDDNEADRILMKECLKGFGFTYEWIECCGGEEALDALNRSAGRDEFAAAIVDTVLPGMDGFETCRRIKQSNPTVKVVMITGMIDAVDAVKARECGADEYCVKTSRHEPLGEALKSLRL